RRQAAPDYLDNEFGSRHITMIFAMELKAQPMMGHAGFIPQQNDRLVDMADDEVGQAIVIEVADGQAAADMIAAEIGSSLPGNVRETAVALVAKQDRPLPHTGAARKADYVAIGDHQVGVAVVIQVEKAGSEAYVGLADCR